MVEIRTSMIEFPVNGETAPGYMTRPVTPGQFPGVVVIQEWWGLDDHIKSVVDRVASEGFVAVAPDFYRGQIAAEPDDARRLAMQLERPKAALDVQGAVDYLLAQSFVIPKKAGIMGFCMGGAIAGAFSYTGQHVGATVSFYGGGFKITDEIAGRITAPFLGIYGEEDQGIPQDVVQENERQLKTHNIVHQIMVYPGAPHAFFNDTRAAYRPDAAADAWVRAVGWFKTYLAV